jgi:hypothetical protein
LRYYWFGHHQQEHNIYVWFLKPKQQSCLTDGRAIIKVLVTTSKPLEVGTEPAAIARRTSKDHQIAPCTAQVLTGGAFCGRTHFIQGKPIAFRKDDIHQSNLLRLDYAETVSTLHTAVDRPYMQ